MAAFQNNRNLSRQAGFSFVELLTVVAIIGVLIALLLPAVQAARETTRRSACANNLRQISLAVTQYETTHRVFPPAFLVDPTRHNMYPFIMPYMEMKPLVANYRFDVHWNDSANANVIQTDVDLFVCPSAPAIPRRNTVTGRAVTDYGVCRAFSAAAISRLINTTQIVERANGCYSSILDPPDVGRVALKDVRDGLSHSMMLFEDGGRPQHFIGRYRDDQVVDGSRWACYSNYWVIDKDVCEPTSRIVNSHNGNEIYSFHATGCNFAYGDAAVRFHVSEIAPEAFVSFFTRSGGDFSELGP